MLMVLQVQEAHSQKSLPTVQVVDYWADSITFLLPWKLIFAFPFTSVAAICMITASTV